MKSKEDYWARVIKGFERSGLSQEEFCDEQGIPIAKFKYQWRKKMALVMPKSNSQNTSEQPIHFEPIRIRNEDSACLESIVSQSIIIQFPNQISCELKMDIKSREFSSLLNQLRSLC